MSKRAGGKKSRSRRGLGYQKYRFDLRVVEKDGERETPQAKLEREAREAESRQSEMHARIQRIQVNIRRETEQARKAKR